MDDLARLKALRLRAAANAHVLSCNSYPGRMILIGLANSGEEVVVACAIMGRSSPSRNRVYEETARHSGVKTAVADPSKPSGDPALTIYHSILAMPSIGVYFVSNGHQTDDMLGLEDPDDFMRILRRWSYEDEPNHTARITGMVRVTPTEQSARLAILKYSPHDDGCLRQEFVYPSLPMGVGLALTTYSGDGSPLPPFEGEPFPLPLLDHPDDIAAGLWDLLDPENRVGLAVKLIPIAGGESQVIIINKYEKVMPPA